jgi:hypothetical protein
MARQPRPSFASIISGEAEDLNHFPMAGVRGPNTKLNLHGQFTYFLYDLAVEISSTLNFRNPYVLLTHWNATDNAAKYLLILTDIARNLTRLYDSVNETTLDIEWAQI